MIDLDKLEELARAATPGPWYVKDGAPEDPADRVLRVEVDNGEVSAIVCRVTPVVDRSTSRWAQGDMADRGVASCSPTRPGHQEEDKEALLHAILMEDKEALLHAILMALQERTWTDCRNVLMKALEQSYDGELEAIPEDEDVYGWRDMVVAEHQKQRGRNGRVP